MTEQLEAEVRAALRERAAQVPAASIARLTHIDYRPRTRRLEPPWRVRPPLAIGALTTAAGTAGAVAVIVSLTAGASNAFAGWTAKPTPPAPGQLAGARASCETSQSPISGLPLKLADTRGPYTFAIYADSSSSAACIKGPSFVAVSASVASSAVNVPAGQILLSASHQTDRGGDGYSFADGRTGAGVSGVTLTLDDGTNVQATVGGGWFVAWWPGGHLIKSAELSTPTGVVTQTFNLSPEIPCRSAPRCSSSRSDVGGGGPAAGGMSVSGFASGGGGVQSGSAQSYSRSR
jgi:uncharacterized membrane protein YgcG